MGCYRLECVSRKWFVGVNGDDSSTCKYTTSISKYNCPMNCTDRGTCLISDNGTRTCECNKVSSFCSLLGATLDFMIRKLSLLFFLCLLWIASA